MRLGSSVILAGDSCSEAYVAARAGHDAAKAAHSKKMSEELTVELRLTTS